MSASTAERIANSGNVAMTCECGYADTVEAFSTTPIFGELPRGEFQCPVCKQAIKLQVRTDPRGERKIEVNRNEIRM